MNPCTCAPSYQLKGIFVRNLAQLNKVTGKCAGFLSGNAHSVWTQDRNSNNLFGLYGTHPCRSTYPTMANRLCRALRSAPSTPRFNSHIIEERDAALYIVFEQHHSTD
jgi:hypothetical protein